MACIRVFENGGEGVGGGGWRVYVSLKMWGRGVYTCF